MNIGSVADGNKGQGGRSDGGGFGLGVSFALSPELAQKVRECKGIGTAAVVPTSSLTFLKGGGPTDGGSHEEVTSNGALSDGTTHASGTLAAGVMSSGDEGGQSRPPEANGYTSFSALPTADGAFGCETIDHRRDRSVRLLLSTGQSLSSAGEREEGNIGIYGDRQSTAPMNAAEPDSSVSDEIALNGNAAVVTDKRNDIGENFGMENDAGQPTTIRGNHVEIRHPSAEEPAPKEEGYDASDNWEELDDDDNLAASLAALCASELMGNDCVSSKNASKDVDTPQPAHDTIRDESSFGGQGRENGEEAAAVGGNVGNTLAVRRVESLPLLLVDLARVCGFRVRGVEEAAAVCGKIRAALHESFRERSEELFEMGSAVHTDTSSLEEALRLRQGATSKASWAVVEYPTHVDGISVEEAWGKLATPSHCAAVEAVRRALIVTNRHVIWKRDMLEQLEEVAANEREMKATRDLEEKRRDLEDWRARRREQLERLIEIRPMFERRRMMAEEKLLMAEAAASPFGVGDDGKEDAGDAAVSDPVSAAVISSLGAKLESIDDLIARLEIEEGEDGHGFVPSDEDEEDDYEYEFDYEFLEDLQGLQHAEEQADVNSARHPNGSAGDRIHVEHANDYDLVDSGQFEDAVTVASTGEQCRQTHVDGVDDVGVDNICRSSSNGHGTGQKTQGAVRDDQLQDSNNHTTPRLCPNGGFTTARGVAVGATKSRLAERNEGNDGFEQDAEKTDTGVNLATASTKAGAPSGDGYGEGVESTHEQNACAEPPNTHPPTDDPARSSPTVRHTGGAGKKRKKKKKKGVVQQLQDRGSATKIGGVADEGVAGDNTARDGEEGDPKANAAGRPGAEEEREGGEAVPPVLSLVDAVAAMILGRYPQDPSATAERHFAKIAFMHQHMKDAWLKEFGRLPPMPGAEDG